MKNTVLTYGLIAGIIVSAWLQIGIAIGMENMVKYGMYYGFGSMIIAFSFIYVAVKKYREDNRGEMPFLKAFKIGVYISLIASTIYVGSWLIDYYLFVPDFMDKYSFQVIKQLKADGANASEINEKSAEMIQYKEMYRNPIFVVLFTYMEILPVGILFSVLTALILRTRKGPNAS